MGAIEFGVAAGNGLLAMQREAEEITRETGVRVKVFGFDSGTGLPALVGDHRDHPDIWRVGDYPMNEAELRRKLHPCSTLILGDVEKTVSDFFLKYRPPPIGFVSVDLDLYSSTRAALRIFESKERSMLLHVPMYFDDVDMFYTHTCGGELLAIREFNEASKGVFIDRWRGIKSFRPFPEAPYLDRFFVAHDLNQISHIQLTRKTNELPIEDWKA
jgi:hypothetical protein